MKRWEYLTVWVNQARWQDSLGGQGNLPNLTPRSYEADRIGDPTELLNDLGEHGWDLVGVASEIVGRFRLFLKRPKS
jgi:hypothetical protein